MDMPYIGIGRNPDGPDLPLGLGMNLAQDPKAMETFAKLSSEQKKSVIQYVQGGQTGEEAKNRIYTAIKRLHAGETIF